MYKCILCGEPADERETKEFYRGFCKKCKEEKFNSPVRSNKKKNILRDIENISNHLDDYIKNAKRKYPELFKRTADTFIIPDKSKPTNEYQHFYPTPGQKSSIIFKGEVRPLNEKEQKIKELLTCSYCKLQIVRELYYLPLVILKCGDIYHTKCFAKLMAEGKYNCPNCDTKFFTSNNERKKKYDSDDDEGDFF